MSILQLQKRQREIGRLRLGTKATAQSGKQYPKSLDTWRLTSPSKSLIEAAATLYGGTVERWGDQWEVVTKTVSLPVMVPPQDVGRQQNLELWSKGGLLRRCDGTTCYQPTDQAGVFIESACICAAQDDGDDAPKCSPSTILRFWLPQVPGLGVWILTSTGWNVASELAADVELLAGKNVQATLSIEHRESKQAGQTKKFVVPVLEIPVSLAQLLEQGFSLNAPAQKVSALPSPTTSRKETAQSVTVLPPVEVGEEQPDGGADDELLARVVHNAQERLKELLAEGAPTGTMEANEVKLRQLFRALGLAGLVPDSDKALHDALARRGAAHVSDLKAAELVDFCRSAWEWAGGLNG